MARAAQPVEITRYVDDLGEQRIIRKTKHGLQHQRHQLTVSLMLSKALAPLLGAKIRERRQAMELSYYQAFMRSGMIPVSRRAAMLRWKEWETGQNERGATFRIATLYAIANALDCTPSDLLPTSRELFNAAGIQMRHGPQRLALMGVDD